MKVSPISLVCRTPGLRWIGERIPRALLFRWAVLTVWLNTALIRPESRASLRPLFEVLGAKFSKGRLLKITKRHLVVKKWREYLLQAWPVWAYRYDDWIEFDGEENLISSLKAGKGVLLLSGHSFGFARLVTPVLAQKGYSSNRVGLGWEGRDISERWGKDSYRRWQHIHYRWNPWQNIDALKKMKCALTHNEVVHVSLQGMPCGEPQFELPFWYNKFFLDGQLLRAIEVFQAPVLPCFSSIDSTGKVQVKIYPAITPSRDEVMARFGPLYLRYLEEYPELSRIWKRVMRQRKDW